MKRAVLISGLGVLIGLSSCSKENLPDLSPNDYITFSAPNVISETNSRSTFIEGSLPEDGEFGVMGYCVPFERDQNVPDWDSGSSPWTYKRSNAYPDVFYKQRVSANGAYNYIESENGLRKWYNAEDDKDAVDPDNYDYTFFAYYPYDNFTVTPDDKNTKGAPKMTFTMPFDGTDLSLDDSQTPDAMLGIVYSHKRSQGNVQLNFSHIMTGLRFAVNNYNLGAENEESITINSIELKGNFVKSITIDFNKETNEEGFYYCEGTYHGTYSLINEPIIVGPNSSNTPEKYLLLLSDAAGKTYFGEDIIVSVNYTYKNTTKVFTAPRPTDFMPKAGTRYTAQLNFIGESFALKFVAEGGGFWEDGKDSNITIQ